MAGHVAALELLTVLMLLLLLTQVLCCTQVFSGLVGVASLTSGMLATVLAYAITQSYSLL